MQDEQLYAGQPRDVGEVARGIVDRLTAEVSHDAREREQVRQAVMGHPTFYGRGREPLRRGA